MMTTLVFCLALGIGPATVGDTIVLRDGRLIVGQVMDPAPRAGGAAILVVRLRAEHDWPDLVKRSEDANRLQIRQAQSDISRRLQQWKLERKASENDRISKWLDEAIALARVVGGHSTSSLVELRLKSTEIQTVTKRSHDTRLKVAKAWQVGLSGVEDLSPDDLNQALEGRGVDLKSIGPIDLSANITPKTETEDHWLIRRAATEAQNDQGLRFLRYESVVIPEPAPGQAPNLQMALGSIGNLTALLSGEVPRDPWPDRLREIEAKGRVGAILTGLRIAADFTQVSVDVTLWVRLGPNRWVPAGSRSGVVRTDALPANAGADLVADPQIKTIFQMVEGLGLGALTANVKQQSLNVGAATQQALGLAREAADRDLRTLAIDLTPANP